MPRRADGFNVYRHSLPGLDRRPPLRQTGEVRGQLHEDAVVLDGADHAGDCVPGGEVRRVLQPGAQQLLLAQGEAPAVPVHGCDHRQHVLARGQPLPWVADPGHGEAGQRDQGDHPAADVHEGPEGGQVGDPGGDHRAGDSVLQQPGHSLLLGPAAGEQQPGLSSAVY